MRSMKALERCFSKGQNEKGKNAGVKRIFIWFLSAALCLCLFGCQLEGEKEDALTASQEPFPREDPAVQQEVRQAASEGTDEGELALLKEQQPFIVINDNQPSFTQEQLQADSYEYYSQLDELGRCGAAEAMIGEELMPTGERESISQVKPTGWHSVTYDNVEGEYLYNRCHLIGYQLTAEQANERNLITGTRYMNVEGMLPFENLVADYVRETGNHVMYRVTPIFEGDNMIASGVEMEAESVEDQGEGVSYHVYVYNMQPGIAIDYATGDSQALDVTVSAGSGQEEAFYVLNISSKKFHQPDCSSVEDIKPANRQDYTGSRQALLEKGYEPCGRCRP